MLVFIYSFIYHVISLLSVRKITLDRPEDRNGVFNS